MFNWLYSSPDAPLTPVEKVRDQIEAENKKKLLEAEQRRAQKEAKKAAKIARQERAQFDQRAKRVKAFARLAMALGGHVKYYNSLNHEVQDWSKYTTGYMELIVLEPGTPVRLCLDLPKGRIIEIQIQEVHRYPIHRYHSANTYPGTEHRWVSCPWYDWRDLQGVIECVARAQLTPMNTISH